MWKKLLFLFLLLLGANTMSSQKDNTVKYTIERNDNHTKNNALIELSPFNYEYSKFWNGVFWSIGGHYNYKNIFTLDIFTRGSYSREPENDSWDFFSDEYTYPHGGYKHMLNFSGIASFLFASKEIERDVRIYLGSTLNFSYYTKARIKRYIHYPLRLGYHYYQVNIENPNRLSSDYSFVGYDISTPQTIINDVVGNSVYCEKAFSIGIGRYIVEDVKLLFEGSVIGTKEFSRIGLWYLDVLFPFGQKYSDIMIKENSGTNNSNVYNRYHVDSHTQKPDWGFRAGYTYKGMQKISFGSRIEIGYMHGFADSKFNFHILFGLHFGLSALLNSFD